MRIGLATLFYVALQPASAATLHDAVEAAWLRLPQTRSIEARQAVAAAKNEAGSAFFPNAATATGSFVNDKIVGSNQNYITSQVELSTPVWLPGEGTATQRAADAEGRAAVADGEALHLAVAEKVLQLVVQAEGDTNQLAISRRRLTTAQALAKAVHDRFAAGESPETDSLAADAEAANAELSLQSAQAQAANARAAYAALTGLPVLPRLDAATAATPCLLAGAPGESDQPAQPDPAWLDQHPRMIAARRALEAAEAKARLVRIENRDNPEIGLQGIDEKQPGTRWDTRMAVIIRLPFASAARNAPRRAAAEQAVTEADVQLELTRRELLSLSCQSNVALQAAQRSQAAATRAATAMDLRRAKIERAWRAGEMPLIELIRADAMAYDSDSTREKAALDLAAARTQARLLQGILP